MTPVATVAALRETSILFALLISVVILKEKASVWRLAAGAIIYLGGPLIADPLLSLFVSLLILFSAGRLLREVTRVLMEGVPRDVDAGEVANALTEVRGVRAVHDMHVWSLSSTSYALAAHVDLDAMAEWQQALPQLQTLLREHFDIAHSTLQPEDDAIRQACDAQADCGTQKPESS